MSFALVDISYVCHVIYGETKVLGPLLPMRNQGSWDKVCLHTISLSSPWFVLPTSEIWGINKWIQCALGTESRVLLAKHVFYHRSHTPKTALGILRQGQVLVLIFAHPLTWSCLCGLAKSRQSKNTVQTEFSAVASGSGGLFRKGDQRLDVVAHAYKSQNQRGKGKKISVSSGLSPKSQDRRSYILDIVS